jgi:hypothetical protein
MPRGRTSSTLRSVASIRSLIRRARGLTLIATGTPIPGSRRRSVGLKPLCRCNNSPHFLKLANDNRAPEEGESAGAEPSMWLRVLVDPTSGLCRLDPESACVVIRSGGSAPAPRVWIPALRFASAEMTKIGELPRALRTNVLSVMIAELNFAG